MNTDRHLLYTTRLYEQFARIGKALASPRRLEILDLLAQAERTVEDVATATGLSHANASHHLQRLKAAELADVRREGQYAYYRLADDGVYRAWTAIRELAERRLSELDRVLEEFLGDRRELEPLSMAELRRRLKEGDLIVLDVRPLEEYRAGHIPGARSLPLESIERSLAGLPEDREIVAYCRGPYCVFSHEAVALLRSYGLRARRLEDGMPEWRAAGFPVTVGVEPDEGGGNS